VFGKDGCYLESIASDGLGNIGSKIPTQVLLVFTSSGNALAGPPSKSPVPF